MWMCYCVETPFPPVNHLLDETSKIWTFAWGVNSKGSKDYLLTGSKQPDVSGLIDMYKNLKTSQFQIPTLTQNTLARLYFPDSWETETISVEVFLNRYELVDSLSFLWLFFYFYFIPPELYSLTSCTRLPLSLLHLLTLQL